MVKRAWDFGMTRQKSGSEVLAGVWHAKLTFDDVLDGDDLERLGRLEHNNPLETNQRRVLTPLDYHDASAHIATRHGKNVPRMTAPVKSALTSREESCSVARPFASLPGCEAEIWESTGGVLGYAGSGSISER